MATTDQISSSPTKSPSHTYPFATAPDIIRSHQKDAYFRAQLFTHLSTLLRSTLGSRIQHTYSTELSTLADTLYLSLTTLLGNRTLGEEYCDLVQTTSTGSLPHIGRRAGYIVTAILLPYLINRILPSIRAAARRALEATLPAPSKSKPNSKPAKPTLRTRLTTYLLTHLPTILSPSPLQAATLTAFYFTGTYYHLSKRLLGLRYIFPRTPPESHDRVGYEVLGVLLVLQIGVQSWLHLRSLQAPDTQPTVLNSSGVSTSAVVGGGAEVSLDSQSYAANTELLFLSPAAATTAHSLAGVGRTTHTEVQANGEARYGLADAGTMAWIGPQGRKCTLCLEELKDPSVVGCGHVFCWECIWDWVREKAECPLCRRDVLGQHILPLRA